MINKVINFKAKYHIYQYQNQIKKKTNKHKDFGSEVKNSLKVKPL